MARTFIAADETGNHYTIHEHRSRISTATLDDPGASIEGLARYACNGGAVNRLDDRTFEILATGARVTVIDE